MNLPHELATIPDLEVATDDATLERASVDASIFKLRPVAVVYPRSAAAIGALVAFVRTHANEGLSLTARSGGTDMSGGPLTLSLVVDMSRHFIQRGEVSGDTITTQPGLPYRDLEKATLEHGLLMPAYPASREYCTVGGMVANNAGGEKTLLYGQTDRYVVGLKAVLADGREYTIKPLEPDEATAKMKQPDFEGRLYHRIATLLNTHEDLLQRSRPLVTKNATGYNMWHVWDGHRFDLTKLLVGSQGTLGLITEVTWRLIKPKPHRQMLVLFLNDTTRLAEIIRRVLHYQPESFESYDNHTLSLALKFWPSILKRLKSRNIWRLVVSFGPELKMLLRGGLPQLVLLAEISGHSKSEVALRIQAAHAAVQGLGARVHIAASALEAEKYWTIRRESFNLLREHVHGQHTAPFIDDIIVRPQDLSQFLPELTQVMAEYKLTYTVAGHVGDGNFHIIPLMDFSDPHSLEVIEDLSKKVFALVKRYGGSISGEHNDGLIRSHFLPEMYGDNVFQLFTQIKQIFDPDNIFNPGKKIGADWQKNRQFVRHDNTNIT